MRIWPSCLTYGNWGGPGWSSGKFTNNPEEVEWSVPGVDLMDTSFRLHDLRYQRNYPHRWADRMLSQELERHPAPPGLWPKVYRLCAIGIFWFLGMFTDSVDRRLSDLLCAASKLEMKRCLLKNR